MALREALDKKGGLTLSQLANYDDLITDALVDRVSTLSMTSSRVFAEKYCIGYTRFCACEDAITTVSFLPSLYMSHSS